MVLFVCPLCRKWVTQATKFVKLGVKYEGMSTGNLHSKCCGLQGLILARVLRKSHIQCGTQHNVILIDVTSN